MIRYEPTPQHDLFEGIAAAMTPRLEAIIEAAVERALVRLGARFEQKLHPLQEKYGDWMTIAQVAGELRRTKESVHAMVRRGLLPRSERMGRNGVFPTSAVMALYDKIKKPR